MANLPHGPRPARALVIPLDSIRRRHSGRVPECPQVPPCVSQCWLAGLSMEARTGWLYAEKRRQLGLGLKG
jgi:hypothetical protein